MGKRWIGRWVIAVSALHTLFGLIACIIGGPDWYRFFGAGEEIARAAERGAWMPTIVTLGIAAVLAAWAAFAFSAAGVILRLPLTRTALVAISGVLLLRALAGLFGAVWRPDLSGNFMLISSLIVLALGLCFAIGTWQSWMTIANRGV